MIPGSLPITYATSDTVVPREIVGGAPYSSVDAPMVSTADGLSGPGQDLWLYRDRTIGMLRRYLRLSIEVGRLPSLLGREFFRTRVTSYTVSTFEDAVIFVHDIERILGRLDEFDKKIIAKVVFQDYSQDEAARLLNCGRRTVVRRFPEAVDRITDSFLSAGLLARLPQIRPEEEVVVETPKSCQGGEMTRNDVSDCEHDENKVRNGGAITL
jgi:predicted DNA-binding protein (UPF0251 family)